MATQARRVIEIEVLADDALRKLGGIEKASRGAERSLSLLERQARSLGTAFQGLVGFLGVSEFIALADAAADIEARLSSVSGSVSQGRVAFNDLLEVSLRLGVGIEELAASYTKLGVAVPTAEHEELTQALDIVSTVLATTGASVQQVNAVLLQFSQALGSGALQGDEFRAIAENAPVLLRAWRDAIGESNTAFRELSASAKLTEESLFENLDAIEANVVAMTGMSEPPLTVARAFQNLRSQALALISESNGVTSAFALLAQSIQLVAENLDLVVSAAVAFGAVALARVLKEAATASGALAAGLAAASTSGALLIGLAWGTLVSSLTAVARALASIAVFNLAGVASSLGALALTAGRLAAGLGVVLATLGRLIPVVAGVFLAFEAITWVIDRVVDWWTATERLEQAMREAEKAILDVDTRMDALGVADVDTSKLFELERAAKAGERGIRELNVQLESLEKQRVEFSTGFVESAEDVNNLRRLNEQIIEVRSRIGELTESSARYRAEIEQVKASNDELGSSFQEITAQADAFAAAQKLVDREDLKISYELDIVTAELPEEILRLELDQEFFRVVDQAQAAIDEALAKIRVLETQRKVSRGLTEAEVEKLDSQISTLNNEITKNRATIEATTQAWERHGDRLFETRREVDELTKAKRAAEEQTRREEQGLASYARALRDAEAATAAAEGRLAAFNESGAMGVEAFDEQLRIMRAYEDALRLLNPQLENVTEAQLRAARAVADLFARQASAESAFATQQASAESVRALAKALNQTGAAAAQAEGALEAFRRGGVRALDQFEKRAELQEAFNDALEAQSTTLETATEDQLAYAERVTDALAKQLRAQEELNRAKQAEARIDSFRAQVTAIGVSTEIGEVDVGDIQATLDRAESARFRGQQAQAEALLERAKRQTEAFAETVDSLFDEKRLEDLRQDLIRSAEDVLGPEAVQRIEFGRVEAALAQEEFALAVTFDPASVSAAIADLQAQVSAEPLRVPVVIDTPGAPTAPGLFGGGAGIPPGTNLAEALTGAANAVGGL